MAMKKLLVLFLLSLTLIACSSSDNSTVTQTSPIEAAGLVANDFATIIDVRTASEWNNNHIAGAVHIPMSQLRSRLDELKSYEGQLIMQCAVGGRSSKAVEILQEAGFSNVSNMNGGLVAWQRSNLPVE